MRLASTIVMVTRKGGEKELLFQGMAPVKHGSMNN